MKDEFGGSKNNKDYNPRDIAETLIDNYHNVASDPSKENPGNQDRGLFLYNQRKGVIQMLRELETPEDDITKVLNIRLGEEGKKEEIRWAESRLKLYTGIDEKKERKYRQVLEDINR